VPGPAAHRVGDVGTLVVDQNAHRIPRLVGQRNSVVGAVERRGGGLERRVGFGGPEQRGELAQREGVVDRVWQGLVDVGQVAALHHQHEVGAGQHLGGEPGAEVVGEVDLAAGHRLDCAGGGARGCSRAGRPRPPSAGIWRCSRDRRARYSAIGDRQRLAVQTNTRRKGSADRRGAAGRKCSAGRS
jgi:hypothetical protein